MLSYAEIGPAAMLSRACAGLVRGGIVVALPGSEAAVRLAMTRAGGARAGASGAAGLEVARCVRSSTRSRSTEARRDPPRVQRADRAGRARARLAALARRVLAEDVIADADVPPFARAMMDGYAVHAGDTTGASRETPRALCWPAACSPARCSRPRLAPGRLRRDRHRRAVAGGRRRRRDGRGDRAVRATGGVAILAAATPGQHVGRAGADIARGASVLRAGDVLLPSRVGVLAALGRRRGKRLRAATGRRSSRPATKWWRRAARWRQDRSTTSTATPCRRWSRPTGACRCRSRSAGDTLEALDRAVDAALGLRRGHLLRRQLGRRSRSAARRAAPARPGGVPRHRDAARQAHRVWTPRRQCRSSACPATRRRA